ncbi:hypothetical protein HELRODRAFT_113546 [Helobdella robusta]|uniref:Uncharacterized protein n=1 Tax=Helobdella robusta TaxID=6412 RepID=T1EFT3_HELRO|nr:hypothetical protein HELRODRAFT_113546 [Helobdella robusta]ESN99758.1 hypothetical protein HELRODRAFT_113546 [Helobdella robusta]
MDVFFWLVVGILLLVILLLGTIFFLVLYAGLLYNVEVGVGEPPVQNFVGFYKSGTGAYRNSSAVFTEACSIAPTLSTFGVFYDDPKLIEESKLRWISGSVVPKNLMEDGKYEEEMDKLTQNGFKMFEFPSVSSVVKADFPFNTDLSVIIGAYRVYPKLSHFVQEHKLKAFPYIEFYKSGKIHYYAPLEKNLDFYVPGIDPAANCHPYKNE